MFVLNARQASTCSRTVVPLDGCGQHDCCFQQETFCGQAVSDGKRQGKRAEWETSSCFVLKYGQFTGKIFRRAVEAGKHCGKDWLYACSMPFDSTPMIYLNVLSGKQDFFFLKCLMSLSLLVMNYCKHSAMSFYILTSFELRC